jgi:hypothetical protein
MIETSLRNLSVPLRVLFTSFLLMIGIGYLAALTYLSLVDVEPHAAKGQGLIEGIAEKYHGAPTRLEVALRGAMADRIGPDEKERIYRWIRNGARADDYDTVKPVIEAACVKCHNPTSGVKKPNGESLPSFATYDDVLQVVEIDRGPTIAQLAKVSHVHLFGISFLFFVTGYIFSMSETAPWFRALVIVTPYAAILADIGAWWLTKWEAFFAWIVVIGGALMGLALAVQILVSLWEMWLSALRARSTG